MQIISLHEKMTKEEENINMKYTKPTKISHAEWTAQNHFWDGKFEGKDIGVPITVLFYTEEKINGGTGWHVHDYDELFIVRQGNVLFTIGEQQIEAKTGDILFGPANIPHKYHNIGPGVMETLDIHLSDRFKTSRPTQVDPYPNI